MPLNLKLLKFPPSLPLPVAAPVWHGQLGHLPKCFPSADCHLCGPPTLTAMRPPVAAIAATHVTLDEGSSSGPSLKQLNSSNFLMRNVAQLFQWPDAVCAPCLVNAATNFMPSSGPLMLFVGTPRPKTKRSGLRCCQKDSTVP
jgi:hypothetical protein